MKKKIVLYIGLLLTLALGLSQQAQAQITQTMTHDGTYYTWTGTIKVTVPSIINYWSVRSHFNGASAPYELSLTIAGQSIDTGPFATRYNAYGYYSYCYDYRYGYTAIKIEPGQTFTYSAKYKAPQSYACGSSSLSIGVQSCSNIAANQHYYRIKTGTNEWKYAQITSSDPRLLAINEGGNSNSFFIKDGNNSGQYLGTASATSGTFPRIQKLNPGNCAWEDTPFFARMGEGDYFCETKKTPAGDYITCGTCNPTGRTIIKGSGIALGLVGGLVSLGNGILGGAIAAGGATLAGGEALGCSDLPPFPANRTGTGLLGLEEVAEVLDEEMSFFPNPSKGASTLRLSYAQDVQLTVEVLDMQGRLLSSPVMGQYLPAGSIDLPLDLSGLESGTYLLRVYTADGAQQSQKFVKE